MMQNLLLEEGGLVQVESVNLQVATYSKFQPQSPDFLDITNPKAVYPSETGGLWTEVGGWQSVNNQHSPECAPTLGTTCL